MHDEERATIARVPVVPRKAATVDEGQGGRVPVVARVSASATASPPASDGQAPPGRSEPPALRFDSRHPLLFGLVVAVPIGIVATWLAETPTSASDTYSQMGYSAQMAAWTALFGTLTAAAGALMGARMMGRRITVGFVGLAVLAGAIAGAVGGFLTNVVYEQLYAVLGDVSRYRDAALVAVRALAWAPIGLMLGAAAGLVTSRHRVIPGLIGGGLGAAAGGAGLKILFVAGFPATGNIALYTGSTLTAIGILLGASVADRRARSLWIQVIAGPLSGREVSVFGEEATVGRDPGCEISIANDPELSARHLTLRVETGGISAIPNAPVVVGGVSTDQPVTIQPGTVISLGESRIEVTWKVR